MRLHAGNDFIEGTVVHGRPGIGEHVDLLVALLSLPARDEAVERNHQGIHNCPIDDDNKSECAISWDRGSLFCQIEPLVKCN